MATIRGSRERRGLSQRELSRLAGVSFRGIQLLERPGHDARVSSLEKVADALGLPAAGIRWILDRFLAEKPDSAFCASLRMHFDGPDSWKVHLLDFVDRFRARPDWALVPTTPAAGLDPSLATLLASTVDTLCAEAGWDPPLWSAAVERVPRPWFVSGVENLKASALIESPARFRRRNIFVLSNFLARV